MRSRLAVVLVALASGMPGLGYAQVARMEVIPFQSMTLTDQEFLTGRKDGKPVMIAGELRLPRPGTDRLPILILVHGSGGISGYVTDWEQELNEMGVATFVIDSWSGRGIVSVVNDQSQAGRLVQLFDAYRAQEVLERHPRLDPARIAVMGFSRGGQAALYSSLKRFQRMHGPASGREFAAYIAFYPTCNTVYRDDEDVSVRPVRIFHGSADDYVPVGQCRSYAERLKAKGRDIRHTEYSGAHHVFDWRALKKPVKLEKAQTTRQCQLEEGEDGGTLNAKTKLPFTYRDPCVEYGPTIAYDENASNQSRQAVKDIVTTVLKP
jgi:dienelactone hydrolase